MDKDFNASQINFNKLSSVEWWDKIDKDLKGKPRELLYRPIVGELKTKPFYHYDDSDIKTDTFQYQQKNEGLSTDNSWLLGQKFYLQKGKEKEVALLIVESINGDAQYLELIIESEFDQKIILEALKNYEGHLILSSSNEEILSNCLEFFNQTLNATIIGEPNYLASIFQDNLKTLLDRFANDSPFISFNSNCFVESGANEIQEAVYILASLNEIAEYIVENKIKVKFLLRLNTGSNFFLQIAKFRTIRKLVNFVLKEWELDSECIIEAQSSKWNKSVYDRFTNILRLSSESFSAIVGGVDVLNISGFEESLKIENSFTHRNARNISHLLKHESHLDKVADHAAGSYFVESLCQEYSELVWNGFQEIEMKGGFRKFNLNQSIFKLLEESKSKSQDSFGIGKIKMLGTNTFPNPLDELTNENIIERESNRLAYSFEKLRAGVDLKNTENGGMRPVATMLKLGKSEMRFARAGFATNFLETAGIRIEDYDNYSKTSQKIDFIVICSSDEEYLENGLSWLKNIKENHPQAVLILAGNPENREELKRSGIDFLIHLKAPLEQTLVDILKSIGIEKA